MVLHINLASLLNKMYKYEPIKIREYNGIFIKSAYIFQ